MTINEIIKKIRLSLGLSQTDFSKQMHVSFSTVNRWENGHTQPNEIALVMLIELCRQKQVCQDMVPELERLSGANKFKD